MNICKWFILFLVAIAISACSNKEGATLGGAPASEAKAEAAEPLMKDGKAGSSAAPDVLKAEQPRMIIYNGTLRVQVEDIEKRANEVKGLVNKYGGYLASEANEQLPSTREWGFALRIPQQHFTKAMEELAGLGSYIAERRVTGQDVTQEFVDNEARLKTKLAAEQQFIEIMRRAHTVSEVLDVQNYLRQVREEIEVMQGRQKYLRNQTDMATITLTLYVPQRMPPSPREGFWYSLGSSLERGWNLFLDFSIGLATFWPFLLVIAGGIWGWRRWRRKK